MELRKTFRFEASHISPKHPGKCSRLHGHSWVLHVYVEGQVDPRTGFVMDYALISENVKPIIDDLDHRHLGQYLVRQGLEDHWPVPGREGWVPSCIAFEFYPSSENLLILIGQLLTKRRLPWSKLVLEETCTSQATLTRAEFDRTVLRPASSASSEN